MGSKQSSSTVSAQLTAATVDKTWDAGELAPSVQWQWLDARRPLGLPLSFRQKHFRYARRPQCGGNRTVRV